VVDRKVWLGYPADNDAKWIDAMENSDFTESEYSDLLEEERYMFAWTLRVYGGYSAESAMRFAHDFYPYEEPGDLRGIVFHDEAWHWAMMKIFGDFYWISYPEFDRPPSDYRDAQRNRQATSKDSPPRQQ
jgi:hypothetical protein